jgi:hypothetical protein
MQNDAVVFVSGLRTPFGAFGGSLKDLSATELGVIAAKAAMAEAGIAAERIDHVIFGNVVQTSKDAIYLSRHIALRSGCKVETPAVTVNRLCGSGFEAIVQGAKMLMLGEADFILAGGTESMSQAPHVVRGARWGLRLGSGQFEGPLSIRVHEPEKGRVKHLPRNRPEEGFRTHLGSVHDISKHGMPELLEVHPDLVSASGPGPGLEEYAGGEGLHHYKLGFAPGGRPFFANPF